MSRFDHQKSAKAASIKKHGAADIGQDATLSKWGRPPGREVARNLPEPRFDEFDISPLVYKQESLEFAEAEARRLEGAKSKGPKRPKAHTQVLNHLGKSSAPTPAAKPATAPSDPKVPREAVPTSYEVQQRLPGKGISRTVQVEVLRRRKP